MNVISHNTGTLTYTPDYAGLQRKNGVNPNTKYFPLFRNAYKFI